MEFKRIHAICLIPSNVKFIRGWGYDLDVYKLGDVVTFRHPDLGALEVSVSKDAFRKLWRFVKDVKLPATGGNAVTDT